MSDEDQHVRTCIPWPGRRDKDGYGVIWAGGAHRAHRFIYSLFFGPVPPGMVVMHTCDVPGCVNPSHLVVGTHQENMQDKGAKKRYPRGVKTAPAKLTEQQVREIRAGLPCVDACAKYGIKKSAYYMCRNRETYQDVSP
jgi:hypothetical protein